MLGDKRWIAIVPARSGSKGIPDKNMQPLAGRSLIARAGEVLNAPELAAIDLKLLSTDAESYAEEGRRHGLACPFLRPTELAGDRAGAIETMQQAWRQAETHFQQDYDALLIVEPTCPLRQAGDILAAMQLLVDQDADSVVTVSRVDTKHHPDKLLTIENERLGFYSPQGAGIKARQELSPLYFRNGACYAISKQCLYDKGVIFSDKSLPLLIDRPLANIDEPLDLAWAEFLEQQPS